MSYLTRKLWHERSSLNKTWMRCRVCFIVSYFNMFNQSRHRDVMNSIVFLQISVLVNIANTYRVYILYSYWSLNTKAHTYEQSGVHTVLILESKQQSTYIRAIGFNYLSKRIQTRVYPLSTNLLFQSIINCFR